MVTPYHEAQSQDAQWGVHPMPIKLSFDPMHAITPKEIFAFDAVFACSPGLRAGFFTSTP
jgi:hypothetical protein